MRTGYTVSDIFFSAIHNLTAGSGNNERIVFY
jgi:hypothetical protein